MINPIPHKFSLPFLFVLLFSSFFSWAQSADDRHWDYRFGWPGVTNWVFDLEFFQGKLVASGFSPVIYATNCTVDRWTGSEWESIGNASAGIAIVYDSLAVGSSFYVGGFFAVMNGVKAKNLARFDGAKWEAIPGIEGVVYCLATEGTNLFVGGSFTNSLVSSAVNLARWDGKAWHPVGGAIGDPGAGGDGVWAIHLSGPKVLVGGQFSTAGGVPAKSLAEWDGTSWKEFAGGVGGSITRVLKTGNKLVVGGTFSSVGPNSLPARNIAAYEGSAWSPLGNGFNKSVFALADFKGEIYAGGNFTNSSAMRTAYIARWNGIEWLPLGSGCNDAVQTLRTEGENLFAGGGFTLADNFLVNHVAAWNGTSWSALENSGRSSGAGFFTRRVVAADDSIYLGGMFTAVGNKKAGRIAAWDGTDWTTFGSGVSGDLVTSGIVVNGIAVNGLDVYIGGIFTSVSGVPANSVARWDGFEWHALGKGIKGTVLDLAFHNNELYAVGKFQNAGDVTAFNIAKWDGDNWQRLPGSLAGSINNFQIQSILFNGDDLYIGGNFWSVTGDGNIAMQVADEWVPLGSGLNSNVTALAFWNGELYAGGRFLKSGSASVRHLAKWTGSTWQQVPGFAVDADDTIASLAEYRGDLVVGGNFAFISNPSINQLARFDGQTWKGFGTGLTNPPTTGNVTSIAVRGDDLYVAGSATFAGGKPSFYFAHWNDLENFVPASPPRFSILRGNDGAVTLLLEGILSGSQIESSANLINWSQFQGGESNYFPRTFLRGESLPRFFRTRTLP